MCFSHPEVEQIWQIQTAEALSGGGVFTAGHGHRVVVTGTPGCAGPAGVVLNATALQLCHKGGEAEVSYKRMKLLRAGNKT